MVTLVSNAGVPAKVRGDMLDLAPDSFDFVIGVNLRGAFFLAQEMARRMLRGRRDLRSIMFVTSVSAAAASIERAEYCISKAGAAMMAALFAVRCAARHRRVRDPARHHRDRDDRRRARQVRHPHRDGLVPAARWGPPGDIGAAVLPLVRGDMAFATGAVIPVDGGLSIPRL